MNDELESEVAYVRRLRPLVVGEAGWSERMVGEDEIIMMMGG
jgi:hypothetical protein